MTAPKEVALVHDLTAGIVYCDEDLASILARAPSSTSDPVGTLTRWSWTISRTMRGVIAGAIVATSSSGDSNYARTTLFFEDTAAPYR
jgi:hypothetical protein